MFIFGPPGLSQPLSEFGGGRVQGPASGGARNFLFIWGGYSPKGLGDGNLPVGSRGGDEFPRS